MKDEVGDLEKELLIVGSGELGLYLIKKAHGVYSTVLGVTQTTKRHEQLEVLGALPTTTIPNEITNSTDVVFSVSGSLEQYKIIESLKWKKKPRRAILVSSVGVYGDPKGIVREDSHTSNNPHSLQILETEQLFLKKFSERGVIVRSGGLYSSFKGPYVSFMKTKTSKIGPPNKTLALIHYEDLATAIFNAFVIKKPKHIYNAVIWPSPTRKEFYQEACLKLGYKEPEYSQPLEHEPAKYNNSIFKKHLLPHPAYPNWKSIFF